MRGLVEEAVSREQRLALAYAPTGIRNATLALFALDSRLATVVLRAREPLLAQIRLAWWRDRLGEALGADRAGEPLLALLALWRDQSAPLIALVDAWEALLLEKQSNRSAIAGLVEARGACFAALAQIAGEHRASDAARSAGKGWALVDLAGRLSDPAALALVGVEDWRRTYLPRSLRPLAILHGLAMRAMNRASAELLTTPGDALAAVRLGLFGR